MRRWLASVVVAGCGHSASAPTPAAPAAPADRLELRGRTIGVDRFTVEGDGSASLGGIAEDVSTSLAAYRGLTLVEVQQVTKLTNELRLQRTTGLIADDTMAEIGVMLGVDVMIAGSAVVRGDRIRLNARLVVVASKQVLTGLSVSGPVDELFRLEDELAAGIAARIALVPP